MLDHVLGIIVKLLHQLSTNEVGETENYLQGNIFISELIFYAFRTSQSLEQVIH